MADIIPWYQAKEIEYIIIYCYVLRKTNGL